MSIAPGFIQGCNNGSVSGRGSGVESISGFGSFFGLIIFEEESDAPTLRFDDEEGEEEAGRWFELEVELGFLF